MARGSRSSRTPSARTTATANDPLRSLLGGSISEPWSVASSFQDFRDLTAVEDYRQWNPESVPPIRTVTGGRTWSIVRAPKLVVHRRPVLARSYYTNLPVGLQLPVGVKRVGMFPVVTCVRRAIRRSVIFAMGKRHKGAGASRRRRNEQSKVGC